MHIVSLALGGCLRGEPVDYGITEDTGGHITYILGEMRALAKLPEVSFAEIVTRRFDAPELGAIHACKREELGPKLAITRIDSGEPRYLAKAALQADRRAFIAAFIAELRSRDRLPDLIHAHFADAADIARAVERELGIPYVYTAHSLGLDKRAALCGEDAEGAARADLDARIAEEDRAIAGARAVIGSSRDECERQLLGYPSARIDRIHRIVPGTAPASDDAAARDKARTLIAPFLRDRAKPIVLAIARPVRKKNLAGLVDAFASDPTLRDKANLVILAGQREAADRGEEEQAAVLTDLLARIDAHDLYGHVAYPRQHDSAHVAGLYQLAQRSGGVFVNPALVEPYGLTVVEAAAHGVPVVATRIGGPLDTVNELGHGLLIDPQDTAAIAAAITGLLKDRERWEHFSKQGRTRARALSWDSYASSFLRLARGICAGDAAAPVRAIRHPDALFVSDMDNTLTGCAHGVERLRAFLCERPGLAFAIATGRSLVEARRVHREWGLPPPIAWITSVGSEIYWETGGELSREIGFPDPSDRSWQPERVTAALHGIAGIEPQPGHEQRAFKRSYFYDDEAAIAAVRQALAEAGIEARVIASHGRFLDILPMGAGKAAAMAHVAGTLGIAPARVFAAGDSGNDEDMLSACPNAILVANHAPEIAVLARRGNVYVARANHASGAVEGLEALMARTPWAAPPPALSDMDRRIRA